MLLKNSEVRGLIDPIVKAIKYN